MELDFLKVVYAEYIKKTVREYRLGTKTEIKISASARPKL